MSTVTVQKAGPLKKVGRWVLSCLQTIYLYPFKTAFSSSSIDAHTKFNKEHIESWLKHVDDMQNYARKLQNELAQENVDNFDWSLLGAATYLYHIDRLCIKVREHFLTLRYLYNQFYQQDTLQKIEFIQAVQACKDCNDSLVNIMTLLKKLPKNRLHCEVVVNQIHALELESVGAASALRNLGQFAYSNEAFLNMKSAQKDMVLQLQSESRTLVNAPADNASNAQVNRYRVDNLRERIASFDLDTKDYLNLLLDNYFILSRCYIIKRKDIINTSLVDYWKALETIVDNTNNDIDLIQNFGEEIKNIFHTLQSLRFCANHSSRCSENLADKAKQAMLQFKQATYKLPGGVDFIYKITAHKKRNC